MTRKKVEKEHACYRVAKTHRIPHKLQVIFLKRATYCRALFRKMTYKDKALYDPTPPCMQWELLMFNMTRKKGKKKKRMLPLQCEHSLLVYLLPPK